MNHFRRTDTALQQLLPRGMASTHPFVIGELACGNLHRRSRTLGDLRKLPMATMIADSEAHQLLESRRLWGKGLAWADVHLLGSALISGHLLWTADRELQRTATEMGISYE